MRKLIVLFVVLAMASPVWAQPPFQGVINVAMTIPTYTNVIFQSMNMTFGSPDWQSPTLIGKYLLSGNSNVPTATGYWEEAGGAWIWVESNQPLPLTSVTTSGHLVGSVSGYQIPTWFTTHVNGWDQVLGAPDVRGFANGSPGGITNWVADGTAPGSSSIGGYGGDNILGCPPLGVAVGLITYGAQDGFPIPPPGAWLGNQDAFQMDVVPPPAAPVGVVYPMPMGGPFGPVGPGTLMFHGRILRSGVLDVADTYGATITVLFQ